LKAAGDDGNFIPKSPLQMTGPLPVGNRDADGDEVHPQPQAVRLDITFNILDIIEDLAAISKVGNEAKAAAVERANEKAETLMYMREKMNLEKND
jgi:hypothetical protein